MVPLTEEEALYHLCKTRSYIEQKIWTYGFEVELNNFSEAMKSQQGRLSILL